MDQFHTEEQREEIVQNFLQKLIDSGYNQEHRQEIIKSGCRKFSRRLIEDATGGRPLYRSVEQMRSARRVKSFNSNLWYKSPRGGKDISPKKDNP